MQNSCKLIKYCVHFQIFVTIYNENSPICLRKTELVRVNDLSYSTEIEKIKDIGQNLNSLSNIL